MNTAALAYWRHTGYTKQNVDSVCAEIERQMMALRVTLGGEGVSDATITQRTWDRKEGYFESVIKFFVETFSLPECRGLKGSFVVWLEDGMWDTHIHLPRRAPILAFARRHLDPYTLLIPDPVFLLSQGYQSERQEINAIEAQIGWHNKKPTIFWRGAGSGIGMEADNWTNVPRVCLARLPRDLNDPAVLDACITEVPNYGAPHLVQRVRDAGLVGRPQPFLSFLGYKYLVDVDGYSCAWKSCFLKLCTKSVVLKMTSDNEQWYYDQLTPWINFIPVRNDASDLLEIYRWVRGHEEQCRLIAENAAGLMSLISFEKARREVITLVRTLIEFQR